MSAGSRVIAIAALAVALVAGLYLALLAPDAPPPPEAFPRYSMIWISLDTLRADHLGLYGYERQTSPFLDELGRRGLWFDWAITPQNSTLPVHLTMFAGHHPRVHGIYHSVQEPYFKLADAVRTLPEIVRDAGYRTRGWADGGQMIAAYGFDRGFDVYDDRQALFSERLKRVIKEIEKVPEQEKFFYFIHTYAVHAPYEPPGRYLDLYTAQDDDEPRRAMARYDGAIRFVDDSLRTFVGRLERMNRLQSTILVITSDHGESFREYGIHAIGHTGANLHQNITRVPWIIVHPEPHHRGRIERLVGLIDFPNTILPMLGIEERLPGGGYDLFGKLTDERDYLSSDGANAWSIFMDDHHYLRHDTRPGPERNGLFAFRADPQEQLHLDDPATSARLNDRLLALQAELEDQRLLHQEHLRQDTGLGDEEIRQLKALGYVD